MVGVARMGRLCMLVNQISFNPLNRGMVGVALPPITHPISFLRILAHYPAQLYRSCEPRWDAAENLTNLVPRCATIPLFNSCQIFPTHSDTLLLHLRRVLARLQ